MHRAWSVAFVLVVVAVATPLFAALPVAAQAPSITIVSPNVTTVSALGFRVEVTVADFILDQANYGGVPIPGHGHIHYTVDGGALIATWLTIANIGAMLPGSHILRAELVNNDHTPLSPAAFQELAVTAVAPSITIVAPKSASLSTLGVQMQVAVGGFILDEANYGGTPVPGQGHIHYTVDGGSLIATASPVANFGALAAGAHTLRAELRQNNHAALSPAVFAEMNVTAVAPSIAILSPAATSVSSLGARVVVQVRGFALDAENYAGTPIPGRGHIHYTVDGGGLIATASPNVDLGALTPGAHTIRAELRQNNHAALSPAVFAEVVVTAGAPAISIVSPKVTAVSTLGLRVQAAVGGLILDAENYGGANIPGHGHIHFTVDGGSLVATAAPFADFGALTGGAHTIRAELRNNDHTALSPAVFEEISVTAAAPAIAILEPVTNSAVSTLGFRIRVSVGNLALDPENYGGTNVPGRGHVHFYVDGAFVGAVAAESFSFGSVPPGAHTLRAELANNDHTLLSPAVFQDLSVTVQAPSVAVSLSATAIEVGQPLVVSWTVGGFVVDSTAVGGAPEAGRGHVHIFVDGEYRAFSTGNTFVLSNLTQGSHTVRVELHNNDHTPLTPAVFDEEAVQVVAPSPLPSQAAPLYFGTVAVLIIVIAVLAALLVVRSRRRRGGPPEPGEQPPT